MPDHTPASATETPSVGVIERNGRRIRFVGAERAEFWRGVEQGTWEPETFAVLDRFISNDSTYIDIGAWIGPTVLYAAQEARRSFAFEPDPVAFEELEANVRANADMPGISGVEIHRKAVGTASGTVRLGSRKGAGDSRSSTLFADSSTAWDVETVTLGEFFSSWDLAGRIFIKMDIEGGEYDLVPTLAGILSRPDVALYLSLHPTFLVRSLRARGRPGVIGRAAAWIRAAQAHRRLIRSLPFEHFYSPSGRPLRRRALLTRRSIRSFVSTHEKW